VDRSNAITQWLVGGQVDRVEGAADSTDDAGGYLIQQQRQQQLKQLRITSVYGLPQ